MSEEQFQRLLESALQEEVCLPGLHTEKVLERSRSADVSEAGQSLCSLGSSCGSSGESGLRAVWYLQCTPCDEMVLNVTRSR